MLTWHKSSHSGTDDNCVEVAGLRGGRVVRDGKNPSGPMLRCSENEWQEFIGGVKGDRLR